MMTKVTKLPEKLSDCIELALADLRKVENDPRYRVNMYTSWHEPSSGLVQYECYVCFAGAVMAETLKTPIDEDATPMFFDKHTENRLNALNDVRMGCVRSALDWVDVIVDSEFDFPTTSYRDNPEVFHVEMGVLALKLREAGY